MPSSSSTKPSAWALPRLIYITAIHDLRKAHRSPIIGLLLGIVQTMLMFLGFYLMMTFTGLKSSGIRGDFTLYLLSGVYLFMLHTRTIGAVSAADGPTSQMMLHSPMNTLVSTCAAALSVLYMQVLTLVVLILFYSILIAPLEIENPIAALCMLLISWFSGFAIGLIFFAIKPWFPNGSSILSTILQRINMVASGKMFVANQLPSFLLPLFLWNPLFHLIDQTRGFVFINYEPRVTNWQYPLYFSVGVFLIGLILESHARRHASQSWNAVR